MTDSTSIGDRMKRHEASYRMLLPRRTYTIIRVDGRAFHTYLRKADKPFDMQFISDMGAVAEALCKEISGSVFAYAQSDEISILATDFASIQTQPWFDGVVAKLVSVSASLATAVLNERRPGARALFDARVFTIGDPIEFANYFLWRQRDAVRNSISMAAQAHFPHKRLQGLSGNQMQELLFSEAGVNWNDYPVACRRGQVTVRKSGERDVEYVDKRTNETVRTTAMRSWWETEGAPRFSAETDGWLATVIPALPVLRQ